MRRNSGRHWIWSGRPGGTLIEVAAALAILGSLVVAMLMTEARSRRQEACAQRRLAACRAADELLGQWQLGGQGPPQNDSGRIAAEANLSWRTSVIDSSELAALGGKVVRLEILDESASPQPAPTVVVDVVVAIQDQQSSAGIHAD